ncbi:MAG: sigma-70 family RNA polymerase sigma factor [Bacteroidota bacterium]
MMDSYSDKELLDKFNNKESRSYAFNLLVRKYQKKLYWHIRRIIIDHDDADDVLQNVFIKVWKGLEKFRADSELYTWLYRIATNESLGFLKQKRTSLFIPMIDVESQLSNSLEDDNYFSGDEIQLKLQKAILTLPQKQRVVFNMKYFEGMKYEEMAGILDTSVGALKASYHHAVKKVEKYLAQ